MRRGEPVDWSLIGTNIRRSRILQGFTQEQLAARAEVTISTLYHAEQGRPLILRSLEKICASLNMNVEEIRLLQRSHLTEDMDFLVHRAAEAAWTIGQDRRARVPEDDYARIQEPGERLRLGRLGLVQSFMSVAAFIMPDGPGPVRMELYGRIEGAYNDVIYRDCILTCTGGAARLAIGEGTTILECGDIVGYRSANLRWMEPAGDELPARLTWIGAVRVGKLPGYSAPRFP